MTTYTASGFSGSISVPFTFNGANVNGTWTDRASAINGFPSYTNGTYFLFAHDGTGGRMDITDVAGAGNVGFYNPTTTGSIPTTGTWLNNPAGLTPGTFSAVVTNNDKFLMFF